MGTIIATLVIGLVIGLLARLVTPGPNPRGIIVTSVIGIVGAVIATLFPGTPKVFGSFTGALFTGALPILAVFYVCMGASIDFRATPYIVKKGGTLLVVKVGIAMILGVVFGRLIGEAPVTGGLFAGLSTLAIVAAMNDTNGGLYLALMGQFGRPKDAGAYAIMSLESGPFLTMVTLGLAGLSAFPWPTLVGSILPLLIGMILGNLDRDMRAFLSGAAPVMIPELTAAGSNVSTVMVVMAPVYGRAPARIRSRRARS